MTTIAAGAAYGVGGLGSHLAQLVEDARRLGALERYFALGVPDADPQGRSLAHELASTLCRTPPIRFSPGWRAFVSAELFDRAVAHALEPDDTIVAFAGQALRTFERARRLGYSRLQLVSPTCHVNAVARQHALAYRAHPIERPWLNEAQRRKCLKEYELADAIQVTSEYARRSFLEVGIPAERLATFRLEVDPRFTRPIVRDPDGVLQIAYVGGLTVAKGVPVLLEAFSRLRGVEARLTLVGGWGTRGMRRFLERWRQGDDRITIGPGDPLVALRSADMYVHPSYHDGFGLAPAEALACGVPVVVTEDTGMKEHVRDGVDGWIVPTGDPGRILERLVVAAAR